MGAVRLVTDDGAERRPIVKNAKPETVGTIKEFPAQILVEARRVVETDVKAVDENGDVTLGFVFTGRNRGKGIRGGGEKGSELGWGGSLPVGDIV